MSERRDPLRGRTAGFLSRLSLPVLALLGVLVAAGVGAGGYYAYQTYDFVQHDNDFCMSCHLMQQPYELFAESAHRGLGCKACHQPTLLSRSQMALTQIIENPEELSVHAEVPNERCTECHVDGDPEDWRLIANSAGHRVHFESDDPVLDGLQCVECHSTSLHEFSPIDRTCAQSGCHEDNRLQLGAMSDLTIHCAACHTFVAPVADTAAVPGSERTPLDDAILPDREECLSCHQMRVLVQLPDPDPHGGVCSVCHNPHEQTEPAQAVQSCTDAGCHEDVAQTTPFHRGMQPGVLENCLNCHVAHDFSVDGTRCLDCHRGILRDSLGVVTPRPEEPPDTVGPGAAALSAHVTAPGSAAVGAVAPAPPEGDVDVWAHRPLVRAAGIGAGLDTGWWTHALAPQDRPIFRHSQHRNVECGNCHVSTEEHGGLAVRVLDDCRGCHHTAPVAASCDRCHDAGDAPDRSFREVRSVQFSVGRPDPARVMTFPHAPHGALDCGSCHTEGLSLEAGGVDCASCHEEHHDPENDCTSCHRRAPTSAHPPSEGHVTCSGSGCHQSVPFEGVPRTRQVCLGCHQDMSNHRPDRPCVECHTLPRPRSDE
ncbi:MAG TPA: hypothetical protein VK849_13715 [Longimicrobiales bacterium]|nr:hypothetical protein [Longimicrobiales bacterium]